MADIVTKLHERLAELRQELEELRGDTHRAEALLEDIAEQMSNFDVCETDTAKDIQETINNHFYFPPFVNGTGETGEDFDFDFFRGEDDESDHLREESQ